MRFTVLSRKAASRALACDNQHQLPLVIISYTPTTPNFNVSEASIRLFPDFLRAQNMVRVIEGKII